MAPATERLCTSLDGMVDSREATRLTGAANRGPLGRMWFGGTERRAAMSEFLAEAERAIRAANEACWRHLLDVARADIGELWFSHLDRDHYGTQVSIPFRTSPFRLNAKHVCLKVKRPQCTEIFLYYTR